MLNKLSHELWGWGTVTHNMSPSPFNWFDIDQPSNAFTILNCSQHSNQHKLNYPYPSRPYVIEVLRIDHGNGKLFLMTRNAFVFTCTLQPTRRHVRCARLSLPTAFGGKGQDWLSKIYCGLKFGIVLSSLYCELDTSTMLLVATAANCAIISLHQPLSIHTW